MLLNQIELFVSVAQSRNLAKTARRIHVSPSSVSQRLKTLEREMGAKLYEKGKDGIRLTEAGQVLLETANEIINQIEKVKETINTRSFAKAESLVVGGTYTPSAKYQKEERYPSSAYDNLKKNIAANYPKLAKENPEQARRRFDKISEKIRRSLPFKTWEEMDRFVKGDRHGLTR
jgi:molybdenum-dependent DNA-binding transcriptional regulator ModE